MLNLAVGKLDRSGHCFLPDRAHHDVAGPDNGLERLVEHGSNIESSPVGRHVKVEDAKPMVGELGDQPVEVLFEVFPWRCAR